MFPPPPHPRWAIFGGLPAAAASCAAEARKLLYRPAIGCQLIYLKEVTFSNLFFSQ